MMATTKYLQDIFKSPGGNSGEFERPIVSDTRESTVAGLYVIGDLAGAPVIKLAMAHGTEVIEEIKKFVRPANLADDVLDVLIVGAGAAGLNAALAASDAGLRYTLIEKEKIANTIENFPEGKWVYAEPDDSPPKGKLWLDGATKEDLISRWHQIIEDNSLDVHTDEPLLSCERQKDKSFLATTSKRNILTRFIVLATGQRGNPRVLNVPGEDQEHVYHRLYSPKQYKNESILIVGGGNSAVEAALTLCEKNDVHMSYRGEVFQRVFRENQEKLSHAIETGAITLHLNTEVTSFQASSVTLLKKDDQSNYEIDFDHAFVLIGSELPRDFLRSLGIRMENDWPGNFWLSLLFVILTLGGLSITQEMPAAGWSASALGILGLLFSGIRGSRLALLGLSFLCWYTIYGVKVGNGQEFWPFTGWAYKTLSFQGRSWAFWYTVVYTALMTIFGVQALYRWGISKRDRFQIWRYTSLISFQWIFFFLIPEFLFQYAIEYQWVGQSLAENPQFAEQAWRSYGLVYAWPLFFFTFFYDPHVIWVLWGIVLTCVVIPLFVLFHGKRYCSWICGCGGLAETLGDRWRHLAPKGDTAVKWEKMSTWVLILAVVVTIIFLLKDIVSLLHSPAEYGIWFYRIVIDVWLVGILPVTLYPFLGGKVWCRYWCPLAKLMQFESAWFTKKKLSRFSIESNDKCIGCGECTRYCQIGINVMQYALKQESLSNENSSCIGCGICVSVCPMDTLSFGKEPKKAFPIIQ